MFLHEPRGEPRVSLQEHDVLEIVLRVLGPVETACQHVPRGHFVFVLNETGGGAEFCERKRERDGGGERHVPEARRICGA